MRVLLSAANGPVAPSIIQHLKNLGHYVIGHDCFAWGMGVTFCDEFFVSPEVTGDYRYYEFLASVEYDLHIPFIDEELRLFSQKQVPLKTLCSRESTLRIFTDKKLQQRELELSGLTVAPRTYCSPAIAKPLHGRGGKGIFKVTDDSMAVAVSWREDYMMQRFIEGKEYTVDVLTDMNGAYLYAVPRLRLKANSVSIVGQIQMDQDLIDIAKKLVGKFDFRGPINFQAIRSDEGIFITEVNARFSGSIMFTVTAGFDIIKSAIDVWEGKSFIPPRKVSNVHVKRYYLEAMS